MNFNQFVLNGNASLNTYATFSAVLPRMFLSNSFLRITGFGGLSYGGGATIFTHNVKIVVTSNGGVRFAGKTAENVAYVFNDALPFRTN